MNWLCNIPSFRGLAAGSRDLQKNRKKEETRIGRDPADKPREDGSAGNGIAGNSLG